ncbi:hypothetical protein AMJ85_04720 [candidate division BRC1 bacterium SM23_51]|nr:MAG: hypothetical protein AMJ85_04720 [candidate division BRC1 bacterium SM23_51]
MEWKEYAKEITRVLALKGSPVAVTFSMKPPTTSDSGRYRVCDAFLKARNGAIIDLTAETSVCSGGSVYLGLKEPPKGEAEEALKDFLVNGEKLFCSIGAFQRVRSLSPNPPTGLAEHVIMLPLEKAELPPDLILFICNAEQACRLVTLDGYDTGIPPRIHMAGATCSQAVAYPLVAGELNVSLMDYTSRRIPGYKADDLLVTVPYHRFHGIMRSIPRCTAGTAKMEIPEAFRRIAGSEGLKDLEP